MSDDAFGMSIEFAREWDDEPFTMVPTIWARSGLHWEDMGLLFWLRTHKKNFRFTEAFLIGATPGGRDKVRAILRRLEKAGLIERRKDRNASGRITGTTFIVKFPTLQTSGQRTEKPSVDADQGKDGVSAGETIDGFTGDGDPVNGQLPAETVIHRGEPPTEKPSVDADLHKREDSQVNPSTGIPSVDAEQGKDGVSAGETIDGFTGDGYTGDGKSATKEYQPKGKPSEGRSETTTTAAAPSEHARAGAEPDGSGSSSGSSLEGEQAAVSLLREAVDPAAARRLTVREVDRLAARVAALLEAGADATGLRSQLDPVTSDTTTHPFTRLSQRLDEITAEDHRLAAPEPSPGGASGVVIHSGERHLTYRSCGARDCTGGGNGAVGRGGGTWRRRIDPDTGAAAELCDRLVATRTGHKVTCHPDAAPARAGGA